ncbi:MAG: hypothetical protein KGJ02_02425 [Verrucomicrobiota bacterium]|nr:hypothetical protein [Verrucomicrobiota bacterium]
MNCPCGNGSSYEECCKPFHDGGEPPTPLLLMRSRYAAYARGRADYIQRTTHPKSPSFEADRNEWKTSILRFCLTTEFVRLDILGHGKDWVSFVAYLKQDKKPFALREKSLFVQEDGHWRYLSGDVSIEKK